METQRRGYRNRFTEKMKESGLVYRQMFDAQVQLRRSLQAARSAVCVEDSNTHTLCSSRGHQHWYSDDDIDYVNRLPDSIVVGQPSSDIIKQLTVTNSKPEVEEELEAELSALTQVCEAQVRSSCEELLSYLQGAELQLQALRDRIQHPEHLSLQELSGLWEEVEEEVKLKKIRITKLNDKLIETETQRANQLSAALSRFCLQMQRKTFRSPADVCRLLHTEATKWNQALLVNRRSAARLQLLLQQEALQQEQLLRLHWEQARRKCRVEEELQRCRTLCCSLEQPLTSGQDEVPLSAVNQKRCDIISSIISLVPPSCSPTLVSDWFDQLTAVNQQIDTLHAEFFNQQRQCYEQTWQHQLTEVERCKGALSALELSQEEVNDLVSSQLLPLIEQTQRQDEERLAALKQSCAAAACRRVSVSDHVCSVLHGTALLWKNHRVRLEQAEEKVQQQLEVLRADGMRRRPVLDQLLADLRQQSSEVALKGVMQRIERYLQGLKRSCARCVSGQCQLLDRLPSLCLEELQSYSSSLCSFYRLRPTYTSITMVQNLPPSSTEQRKPVKEENQPISCHPCEDWLTEAQASMQELTDITSDVIFTTSQGVKHSGPAFKCSAPKESDKETHLCLFPAQLVVDTLGRWRTVVLQHLEKHYSEVISSVVAMVTARKEMVRLEMEMHLKLLNAEHIKSHIYQTRLAELQLHRQQVALHCEEVQEVLSSCREDLQELQTSISLKTEELLEELRLLHQDRLTADSSTCVQALSDALDKRLDQHSKACRQKDSLFSQSVDTRLKQINLKRTQLLRSFRLFSEGGHFAVEEVKEFMRRLKEESRLMASTQESINTKQDAFKARMLQQVTEASTAAKEKLSLLQADASLSEKIQQLLSSTRVHIKAEAAYSNQQQEIISRRLEDLRKIMESTEVNPDQVCSLLSEVSEQLKQHCQYLGEVPAPPTGMAVVQSAAPPAWLQVSRTGVELFDDPVVAVIKSLTRVGVDQKEPAGPDQNQPAAGQRLTQQVSVSTLRGYRLIRTDRKFQIFGPEPGQNPQSFSSTVNSALRRTRDVLLQIVEDYYQNLRLNLGLQDRDRRDQRTEQMQQKLLEYQEQSSQFQSQSIEKLQQQLCFLDELLQSFPAILICNHERRQRVELKEEVDGVRLKLQEKVELSEKDRVRLLQQLRLSLSAEQLQTLRSNEELQQQQLHHAISSSHLELQECLRVRGTEFVTSLRRLTETLLRQLDEAPWPPGYLPSPGEARPLAAPSVTPGSPAAMETQPGQRRCGTSSSCTGPLAVLEQTDAAMKRFKELLEAESTRSDDDKQRQLQELHNWSAHWNQQIDTLTNTDTY